MSVGDVDPTRELSAAEARKLLSFILREGEVLFSRHAREELDADGLTQLDALAVLRGGRIYEPGEHVRGSWRYRCHSTGMCVVVAFASTARTVVVTAWRKS